MSRRMLVQAMLRVGDYDPPIDDPASWPPGELAQLYLTDVGFRVRVDMLADMVDAVVPHLMTAAQVDEFRRHQAEQLLRTSPPPPMTGGFRP